MAYLLGDIVANLPAKGGGRLNWGVATDGSLGVNATIQSIQEITESAELEELKYMTPIPPLTPLQMVKGNPVISMSTILSTIPTNALYPQFMPIASQINDITDVYTVWIWFAGGVNQSGRNLEYRRVTAVDMYTYGVTSTNQLSYGVAPPVYWTQFAQYVQVGPSPDQNYFYFVRVKLKHPFPPTGLAAAQVFAPDSWQEILEYSAIVRLAAWEGIQDSSIYKTAHDFLESRGMLPAQLRQTQMQRMEKHNSRNMTLRTTTYSYR